VAPELVEYTIFGHVIQAGQGQITARQAAVGAGIPKEVAAITVNKVCLSGTSGGGRGAPILRWGGGGVAGAGGVGLF
jgi:acetyl-CoA C-acetyltransferase